MSTKDNMSEIDKSTSQSGTDSPADNKGFKQDVWHDTTVQFGLIGIVVLATTLGWYALYSYERGHCEQEIVRVEKLEDRIRHRPEGQPIEVRNTKTRLLAFCTGNAEAFFQDLLLWLALYLPFAGVFYFFVTRRLTTFFYFVGAAGLVLGLHYLLVPRIGLLG